VESELTAVFHVYGRRILSHFIIMNDKSSPDDVTEKNNRIREKIRAIESRAMKNLRHPTGQIRCSFCNKAASETNGLCQSDDRASICLDCAKTVVQMLEAENDHD